MGIIRDFFLGSPVGGIAPVSYGGLLSPNASSMAQSVVWADYFQGEVGDSTRTAAMQIPAIARARSILVGIIANLPLRLYDGDDLSADPTASPEQPEWFDHTSAGLPVWHRMASTVDDLLFYGASLWAVVRDSFGAITDATRIPFELWSYDNGRDRIVVNGKPVDASEVIYIPGPFEGLLAAGGPTIKQARALERAATGRAQNPIPLIELHQLTDDELTDEEAQAMVDQWASARTSPTGAVGFTDNRVELRVHGTAPTDLFVEGRNATVLDIARLTGIPAALLDGSQSTASLTYSTQEGRRSEFMDFGLAYWTAPIEARFSMDDVTPRGTRVRFDRASLTVTPNPTTDNPTSD